MNKLYAALAILAGLTGNALAQTASTAPSRATGTGDWPAKAMHMIVPFPPGSSPDLIARMLGEKLGTALGQPVIVENRPGAGGNLGTALVARAAPDGYTIGLSIGGPLAVNTVLYSKLPYDPFTDLAPITLVAASPNVLVVDPKLGVGSVKQFVALAKSQPGKLNYGSGGNGRAVDAAGGGAEGGGVGGGGEGGFRGFQSTAWLGMVAPAGTPKPVIDRVSMELVRII